MDPAFFELEITESVLLKGAESTLRILTDLRDLGCFLSLDDFGTGYSSLNYLKTLPIHSVKIDRSFIQHIVSDKKDAAITETIIRLAHSLGLKAVAEGVETFEQLTILNNYGCDELQGYYIAKPLSAEFLTRILRGDTAQRIQMDLESRQGKSIEGCLKKQ